MTTGIINDREQEPSKEKNMRSNGLSFLQAAPSAEEVLVAHGLTKEFDTKSVMRNVSFVVRRQDRVAIVGRSGMGKSTLLKILMETLEQDSGSFAWGAGVQIGYFSQNHAALNNAKEMTVFEWLGQFLPQAPREQVLDLLECVAFEATEADKPIEHLSGGEAARLIFAKIMLEKPNVLVLDEPTNHLDQQMVEALIKSLNQYEGTIVFVSHDERMLSQVATRRIELSPNGAFECITTPKLAEKNVPEQQTGYQSINLLPNFAQEREQALNQLLSLERQRRDFMKYVNNLLFCERAVERCLQKTGYFTPHTHALKLDGVQTV